MIINQILMWLMAAGVILGGMDRIFGNRFGLGAKFEEGFLLMGPIGLSMAGIVCMTPLIAEFSKIFVTPVFSLFGIDPGICGGLLAVDTGGYQLAVELAEDPLIGEYAGVILGATFGCTIVFTIPVGMGTLDKDAQQDFARGLLIGLALLPVSLIVGGLLAGLTAWQIVCQSLPVFVLCAGLLYAMVKNRAGLIRCFTVFAKGVRIITTLGLMAGAFQHLTEWEIFPVISPLKDAMDTVCMIAIVMLGCLPLSELLKQALKKPVQWVGRKTGMNSTSTMAILIGFILAMPALAMLKDMDKRGRIVNGAILVCSASAFSAHLGFALGVSPRMVLPMLASKVTGGILAAVIAIFLTKDLVTKKTPSPTPTK